MAFRQSPTGSWTRSLGLPSQMFESGGNDYELYEEDDEFVLSIEMPGFDPDEISVAWDDGVLNVSGEHDDEKRGEHRTYHRRFRLPKEVDEDDITAKYNNGILEVRLPVQTGATVSGTEIEVQS